MPAAQYAALTDAARRDERGRGTGAGGAERGVQGRAQPTHRSASTTCCAPCRPTAPSCRSFATIARGSSRRRRRCGWPHARAPPRPVPSYLAFVLRPGQPPAVVRRGCRAGDRRGWCRSGAPISPPRRWPRRRNPRRRRRRRARRAPPCGRRVWDRLAAHLQELDACPHRPRRRAQPGAVRRPAGGPAVVPARARPGHPLSVGGARSGVVAIEPRTSRGLLAVGGPSFDDRTLFRARPGRRRPRQRRSSRAPAPRRGARRAAVCGRSVPAAGGHAAGGA